VHGLAADFHGPNVPCDAAEPPARRLEPSLRVALEPGGVREPAGRDGRCAVDFRAIESGSADTAAGDAGRDEPVDLSGCSAVERAQRRDRDPELPLLALTRAV